MALEAARRGFDVLVGCGRDRARAGEVAAAVTAAGRRAEVCVADLATPAGVETTAGAARALGPVSLLVNNAGVTNSGPLSDLDLDRWQATLARMLAPHVRVNLVAPGITDTDLLDGITPAQRDVIVAGQPLPRLGTATEIAAAVLDVAGWTYATGQTVVVDGGRVM